MGHKHFFDYLETIAKDKMLTRVRRARKLWGLYYPLACLSAQAKVEITAKQWRRKARKFGRAFVRVYQAEDVTTYIHIFVYHYGYFLERYGGLEKFSNFALEGKHSVAKRILARGTSHFAYGHAEVARQQLAAMLRNEVHDITTPLPASSSSHPAKSWALKQLPVHEKVLEEFHPDPLFT